MFIFADFFKGSFRKFDWALTFGIFIFALASLTLLASYDMTFFWKQFVWYIFAFLIIFFGSKINWRWLISQSWFRYGFYWLCIALLLITNLQSTVVRGTKSWIHIGGFQFEPVELTKIALILILAGFFSKRYISAWHGRNIFVSLLYAFIPAGLVALHPDFGAALVIFCVWAGFLLVSGINFKRLLIGLISVLTLVLLLWMFFLKPYQKDRVTGFISQDKDPLGVNYNVIQAQIAIGSAGFFGKGFGGGTQTQFRFLPEVQSDFIFAAFIEEWGFIGGIILILTFLFIIFRIIMVGLNARSNDFKFISLGTVLVFGIHFFINVGSNLGLVPVAGMTFPFLSYGGSSLLTSAILISIIQNIKQN